MLKAIYEYTRLGSFLAGGVYYSQTHVKSEHQTISSI